MTPQQAIRAANRYLVEGKKDLAVELLRHAMEGVPDATEARIAANRLRDLGVEPPKPREGKRKVGEGSSMSRPLHAALMELLRPRLAEAGSPLPVGTHRAIATKVDLPPALVHRLISDIQKGIDPFTLPPKPPPPLQKPRAPKPPPGRAPWGGPRGGGRRDDRRGGGGGGGGRGWGPRNSGGGRGWGGPPRSGGGGWDRGPSTGPAGGSGTGGAPPSDRGPAPGGDRGPGPGPGPGSDRGSDRGYDRGPDRGGPGGPRGPRPR